MTTAESDLDRLAKLYLFKTVPRQSLEELCALAPPVRFERGHFVFKQGASADVALLLIEGRLVARVWAGTEEREVGDIRAGEIVGEQGLFIPGGERSANVVAAEPSLCLLLTPDLMSLASKNPAVVALEQHLLGTLARRIRRTNQAIQQTWKAAPAAAAQGSNQPSRKLTLRERLNSLLGGS